MATAVSTNLQLASQRPTNATPEMVEVATKVVQKLMRLNFIGYLAPDKSVFEKEQINNLLNSFLKPESRPVKETVRQYAFILSLFKEPNFPQTIIDLYAKFSGYSIVWEGKFFSGIQPLKI